MKNQFIVLSLLCILFIACKKERTCNCSVIESGSKIVHYQSAAVTATVPLPLPIPLPPIEIVPAKDETTTTPYYFQSSYSVKYDKIRKSRIKKSCEPEFTETIFDNSSDIVPGSYTVTTTDQGTKRYSCKIK